MTWKTSKLGNECNILTGNSINQKIKEKKYTNIQKGISYIATKDIDYDHIINYSNGISIPTSESSNFKISPPNSILICMEGGSAGRKIALSTKKCHFGNKLASINVKENLLAKYIYYYTFSNLFKKQFKKATHGLIGGVSISKLKEFDISFPSIPQQNKIISKIESSFIKIDEMIILSKIKQESINSLYEKSVSSIFDSVKNLKKDKLSKICEKITDGTHQTPKYFESGYVFLSSTNVKKKIIDWQKVRYIDEKQHLEMQKRVSPKKGDILLAKNGTTGIAALVDKDLVFDIYVSLALLRTNGKVLPEYLLGYMNSKKAKDQFSSRTKGIGVQNLHLQEIKEVIIEYPDDSKQQKQVINDLKLIDNASQNCLNINSKIINELESLKASIISREITNRII